MPDENRFAGLGDAIGVPDEGEERDPEGAENGGGASDEEVGGGDDAVDGAPRDDERGERTTDSADGTARRERDRPGPERSSAGPAFEFEETTAKSVYVRPETIAVLDDAEFEVESRLRREHDTRDLTGREFHDALVRVAAEHPDEVADAILAARRETR